MNEWALAGIIFAVGMVVIAIGGAFWDARTRRIERERTLDRQIARAREAAAMREARHVEAAERQGMLLCAQSLALTPSQRTEKRKLARKLNRRPRLRRGDLQGMRQRLRALRERDAASRQLFVVALSSRWPPA